MMRRYMRIVESVTGLPDDWQLVNALSLQFEGERSAIGNHIKAVLLQHARDTVAIQGGDVVHDKQFEKVWEEFRTIRYYISSLHYRARTDHDIFAQWYALGHMDYASLLRAARQFRAAETITHTSDDEDEEDDRHDEVVQGYHHYDPSMDRRTYIRFGLDPKGGSIFGLAGEDTEDGPDEWRVASGNKTCEEGICVFVANRHLDDPQGWVLEQPDFEHARYGVGSWVSYLIGIVGRERLCQWKKNPSLRLAHVVRGSVTQNTTRLRYRGKPVVLTPLGSDGEYLIDPRKPYTYEPIALEHIYMDDRTRLVDYLDKIDHWRWCDEDTAE